MVRDGSDHQSLRTALESRIDPMNNVTHVAGSLLNISSGQLTQPNVNVDKALDIGTRQLTQFEASWWLPFLQRRNVSQLGRVL